MECYYHPDKESTYTCAICGKAICEDCGLEIAGKIYCRECLEKIVGVGISNNEEQKSEPIAQDSIETEPVELKAETVDDTIYRPQEDEAEIPPAPQEVIAPSSEFKGISEDSPYNIKSNIEYDGGLESSYIEEVEKDYAKPEVEQPQIAQNEFDSSKQVLTQEINEGDFIYPDHSYEPQPTSARLELEDKYEKYLDDLYFDEPDVPLGEQLAKDEAQYGSLTKKEYVPKQKETVEEEPIPEDKAKKPKRSIRRKLRDNKNDLKEETPEEMEARIRDEILKEQGLMTGKEEGNIHNLNYQDQKEPMGIIDIILSIILVIVVLIVLYYIIYLFLLSSSYPTFLDALFALKNPQNVINALLTH